MTYLWFLAFMCISSSSARQFYDPSNCSTHDSYVPGSRYTCNLFQESCSTFVVFRANQAFHNISDISKLFHMNSDEVNQINNLTSSAFLKPGKEVLLPVTCSCSGQFYQANFSYDVPENTTFSEIACGIFEGLLKSVTLTEENLQQGDKIKAGSELHVPLRCACPDNFTSTSNKVKYLVTYPLMEGDEPSIISEKFGISSEDFWAVNNLDQFTTLFPDTTVLIPLRADRIRLFDIPDSPPPPTSSFLPTLPVAKPQRATKPINWYIAGSVIAFLLLFFAMIVSGLYMKALRKWKSENVQSFTATNSIALCSPVRGSPLSAQTGRSSPASCLSPDLLVGIKYCLLNYSIEELRKATKEFSEETQISGSVYKGLINNLEVMIKRMRFEDTRRVIDLHSKINHINIVNLLGVCYGESDFSWSYLVFEWPKNGCLRDCLANPSKPFYWSRRTQIAFDIAKGLHYLHCCAFPSYAHLNVMSSRNIFITAEWRGKLAEIGMTSAVKHAKGDDDVNAENLKGWVAPEYLVHGSVSDKVDIFAFGVVLLELISARDNVDGKLVIDSIGFLGGRRANEGGCFEELRSFMDPSLKDNYPLAEALCLAVLAKACVADDPLHRPTMDDIMKVLAKMVWPQSGQ